MGGCRCSYRTCTMKSDKKIHMFHFPVFDKVRCHQWLTNAQKLHFLDLKLSQLKNRVVCQHHFKDDNFMNEKKARLRITAVPTEDGPFCTTKIESKEEEEVNPINLEDIENECLTLMEKKAHFSVKYGDFLTNDVSEPITLLPNNKPTSKSTVKDDMYRFNGIHSGNLFNTNNIMSYSNSSVDINGSKIKMLNRGSNNKTATSENETSPYENKLPNPKVVAIEYEELNLNNPTENKSNVKFSNAPQKQQDFGHTYTLPIQKEKQSPRTAANDKKVKIISEKKISNPQFKLLKGELQTVSPSLILKVPDKKKNQNVEMNGKEIQTFYVDMTNSQDVKNLQLIDYNGAVSSQVIPTNEPNLNEYISTTTYENQIQNTQGHSNLNVQNEEMISQNIKPMCYFTSDPNQADIQIKPDEDFLTEMKNVSAMPTELQYSCINIPNVSNTNELNPVVSSDMHNFSMTPIDIQNISVISDNSVTAKQMTDLLENKLNGEGVSINNKNVLRSPSTPTANKSLLKSKIPPEKLAAIEEKRKYNMKLRDIIDSCLSKSEEELNSNKSPSVLKKKMLNHKVGNHLTKDPKLPSSQENTIAYLEARLQRMEHNLLNKIEQNSHRIHELKTTIKPPTGQKCISTQTCLSVDTTKKHLYQQISQFLSPEANSLIYEELFINKYSQNSVKDEPSPNKRRRR